MDDKEIIEAAMYLVSCLCPYIRRLASKTHNKIDDAVANLLCNAVMAAVTGNATGKDKE